MYVLLLSSKQAASRFSVAHFMTRAHAPVLVLSEALAFLHCRLWPWVWSVILGSPFRTSWFLYWPRPAGIVVACLLFCHWSSPSQKYVTRVERVLDAITTCKKRETVLEFGCTCFFDVSFWHILTILHMPGLGPSIGIPNLGGHGLKRWYRCCSTQDIRCLFGLLRTVTWFIFSLQSSPPPSKLPSFTPCTLRI